MRTAKLARSSCMSDVATANLSPRLQYISSTPPSRSSGRVPVGRAASDPCAAGAACSCPMERRDVYMLAARALPVPPAALWPRAGLRRRARPRGLADWHSPPRCREPRSTPTLTRQPSSVHNAGSRLQASKPQRASCERQPWQKHTDTPPCLVYTYCVVTTLPT